MKCHAAFIIYRRPLRDLNLPNSFAELQVMRTGKILGFASHVLLLGRLQVTAKGHRITYSWSLGPSGTM